MTAVTIIILKIEWLFPWLLFLLNAVKIYTFLTNARLEFKWGGWNGGGASSVFCDNITQAWRKFLSQNCKTCSVVLYETECWVVKSH